ncbi:conserved hypothetical protein [Streptomyces sp. SPB78]|nr:conserved hypothetical protein [Streptomyces sp. SPB78]
MIPSPETVSRLRKFPSRIASRAARSRLSEVVSTSVVPLLPALPPVRPFREGSLRDDCCPLSARVRVRRVAAPDSTVVPPVGFDLVLVPDRAAAGPSIP